MIDLTSLTVDTNEIMLVDRPRVRRSVESCTAEVVAAVLLSRPSSPGRSDCCTCLLRPMFRETEKVSRVVVFQVDFILV